MGSLLKELCEFSAAAHSHEVQHVAQSYCKILQAHRGSWCYLPIHPHCNLCSKPAGTCRLLKTP